MGKSAGKTILSIAGFFVGYANPAMFGVAAGSNAALIGGLYGAAIGSSLWTATHQENQDTGSNSYAFDQIANTVSSRDRIPIIYGTRKWGGFETYHVTSSDKMQLTKDIVWCEGDIDSISDVRANDLLINKQTQTSTVNTNLMTITYTGQSENAYYTVENNIMYLYEGGGLVSEIPFEYYSEGNVTLTISDLCANISQYSGWNTTCLSSSTSSKKIPSDTSENLKNTIKTITVAITTTTVVANGLDGCSFSTSVGAVDSSPPSNYTTTGGYRRVAWSRFSLASSANLSGNPTLTAVIKGKKITDTRTGAYAWSANPSMAVRDYLINKRYGAGHFVTASNIDEDSFKEIADYCDELVTTRVPTTLSTVDAVNAKIKSLQDYLALNDLSQETRDNINNEIASLQNSLINIANKPVEYTLEVTPRYELNIIISEQKSHVEILQDMLAVFGGFLVFYNNKVSLRCEMAQSPVFDFNDDNIIQDSMTHTQYPIESSPNQFNVTFYDPGNYYTGVKLVVDNTVSQKKRGKIIPKDVDLTGCTSQSQALRLARMYRDKVELSQIYVAFSTGTMAMHLEPGDVVTLTKHIYPDGIKTLLFDKVPSRINKISEDSGVYTIEAEQYNASIYNDALGALIDVPNYVKISSPINDVIPNVDSLNVSFNYSINDLGSVWNQNIAFSYSIPNYIYYKDIVIFFSENNIDWFEVSNGISNKQTIYNVDINHTYYYKVKTRNSVGRLSEGTTGIIVTSISEEIPDVTSFYGYQNGENTCFYWGAVDYPGVLYEIREGDWDNGIVIKTIISSTELTLTSFISSKTFYIKAMSAYGSYSKNALSVTVAALSYNEVFSINELANQGGTFDNIVFKPVLVTFDKLKEITGKNTFNQFTTEKYIDYESKYVMELVLDGFISWSSPFGGIFGCLGTDGKQVGSYTTPVYDIGYIVAGDTSTENEFISYVAPFIPIFTDADLKKTIECKIAPYMAYVINTSTTIKLYVRTSGDKGNWSSWINFLPINFSFRFVQFKYVLETTDISSTPRIYALYEKIIMKHNLCSSSAYVPVNGLLVNYGYTFYRKPSVVVTPLVQNVIPELKETDVKLSKFFVRLKDINSGEYIAGQMNWQANGY